MRWSEITGILRGYFTVAMTGVALLAAVFLCGYFIVYKRWMKGQKRLTPHKAVPWLMLVGYVIMVLCLTMLDRGSFFDGNANFHLFSSYREAWNNGSLRSWQQVIGNILMFVPLGVLLPFCHRRFRSPLLTVGAGIGFTLFIEYTQLFTGVGIFEVDDLFNNSLGGLLGYCTGMLALIALERKSVSDSGGKRGGKKRAGMHRTRRVVLCLIPLLVTAGVFGGIALKYRVQEFGNLASGYSYKKNMSEIHLSVGEALSLESEETEAMVYRVNMLDREAGKAYAERLLAELGADLGTLSVDQYNDNAIYRASSAVDESWMMRLYYRGGYFDLRGGAEAVDDVPERPENQVRERIAALGTEIPENADFRVEERESAVFEKDSEDGDGEGKTAEIRIPRYLFEIAQTPREGGMQKGTLECELSESGQITELHNRLVSYYEYRKASLISEKEAYGELAGGRFRIWLPEELESLEVTGVRIDYELDTKGFYRPVYVFGAVANGSIDSEVTVPAAR